MGPLLFRSIQCQRVTQAQRDAGVVRRTDGLLPSTVELATVGGVETALGCPVVFSTTASRLARLTTRPLVTMVDQVAQFDTELVVTGKLVDWLRTHQHLDAVCKELISIGPQSCNLHQRRSQTFRQR